MLSTSLFSTLRAGIEPVESRIARVRALFAQADAVIIGAGAGLSAAAGIDYSGDDFRREFRPWIERYGITDLYSSSFYPFATEEERWAYWARHIWFARYRVGGTPLYQALHEWVKGKPHFVITTNVDAQFEKAGFDPERIFATQGDYGYLQDAEGEDRQLYYNEETVREMLAATEDCRIPTRLVPRDPQNGHRMEVNLRCDDRFVEDNHWHRQCDRYADFVRSMQGARLLLLEFGIGYNTPSIIRFPFEQMAARLPHTALVRFNRDYPHAQIQDLPTFIPFPEELNVPLIRRISEHAAAGQGCSL